MPGVQAVDELGGGQGSSAGDHSALTRLTAGGVISRPTRKRHQEDTMSTVTSPDQTGRKMTPKSMVAWGAVAVAGAVCWTVLALARGENVSALWILFAALSSYAIAYRFYSRFIAYRVLGVDNTRATPAERLQNGADFDVTDRRVLFGHHFAAIAGAGPLVGPVLAAQMGYLPGTIWII